MGKHSPRWVGVQKVGTLIMLSVLLISIIPVHASITGPFGTPQLNLVSASMENSTTIFARSATIHYQVVGSLSITGSWYYVNNTQTTTKTTTTSSNSSIGIGYGNGYGTNGSASSSSSSSSSSSAISSSSSSTTVVSQTDIPAPFKLYGYVTFYQSDGTSTTEGLSFSGGQNGYYYVSNTANFTSKAWGIQQPSSSVVYVEVYVVANNPANNETVGAPIEVALGSSSTIGAPIDIYNTIVALPQFNDTMLGAYASKPSQAYPALPLEPYYNLIAIVGIIVLIPLAFLDLISPDKKANVHSIMTKVTVGVLVILFFPYIYDHIAYMLNTLNQMVIAYPLQFQLYNVKLKIIEGDLLFPSTINGVTLLTTGVMVIGYAVVTVIMWIMTYMLGTVRILLIAGMIVMFPLSLALRDFYYTQKLGRMIEDTLFGLMLTTILSSVMLGITGYLLANWNSIDNMFRLAGIQSQWVAISAVLGAILAPTVLAPLVSTVYFATTEVASVAGGVAVSMGMGAVSGGVSGGLGASGSMGHRVASGLIGAGKGNLQTLSTLPSSIANSKTPSSLGHHENNLLKMIGP